MVENAFLGISNLGIRGANKLPLLLFRYTSSVVALMPSNCWDLPSLPRDHCPAMVSSLCLWLWDRFAASVHRPAQCGEIICVSMRGRNLRCRHNSLSPMKSPLPSPTPAPQLRPVPRDTAKNHPDMDEFWILIAALTWFWQPLLCASFTVHLSWVPGLQPQEWLLCFSTVA